MSVGKSTLQFSSRTRFAIIEDKKLLKKSSSKNLTAGFFLVNPRNPLITDCLVNFASSSYQYNHLYDHLYPFC